MPEKNSGVMFYHDGYRLKTYRYDEPGDAIFLKTVDLSH